MTSDRHKENGKKILANGASSLAVVYRDIETLSCDAQNPRLHSKRQVKQIALSIKAFGFNVPFLVDSKLQLIAGHGRLAACKLLGIQRVPTISLSHLSRNQIRAFQIADNKLTENSTWDRVLLANQLKFLSEIELDFDLAATGFELDEIELVVDELIPAPPEQNEAPVPEVKPTTAISQRGDLWLLGRNRLLCGDALDDSSYSILMKCDRAAAVFTDPFCDLASGDCRAEVDHSRPANPADVTHFLRRLVHQLIRSSKEGALHFICAHWTQWRALLMAAEPQYRKIADVCVWVKNRGGEQRALYRGQHELVFVFQASGAKDDADIRWQERGRQRTNVWRYPSVSSKRNDMGTLDLCPGQKPLALVADTILDSTEKGETVLDPFLGGGTTLIAAESTGRVAYGIESDPAWVDIAIRRWQEFTHHQAVHAVSGTPFNEVREDRNAPKS